MPVRLAVAVLLAGLLSSAPLVWGADAVASDSAPAVIAQRASINACCWTTYTSETHGFEMKYPHDLALQEGIPQPVIQGAVLKLLLINRDYYDGTNLIEASLFVGVTPEKASSSERTIDGPPNSSEGGDPVETRDISGTTFSRASSWEGAVGHQYGLMTYSALHAGNCYRLALFIQCVNAQVYDPGTVSEFDGPAVLRLFDQVISTFQFLKRGNHG